MEYIGHKSDDGVNREQALIEHLNGTSALCSEFARRFTMEEIGKLLGVVAFLNVITYSRGSSSSIILIDFSGFCSPQTLETHNMIQS